MGLSIPGCRYRARYHAQARAGRYSDPSYRILVGIERKVGSESSVLAAYRRATEALTELGLQPGDARRLLQHGIPNPRPATTHR